MGSLHHPRKTSMPALGNEGWTYSLFSSWQVHTGEEERGSVMDLPVRKTEYDPNPEMAEEESESQAEA